MSHDALGCADCIIIDHKYCKVDRIQDKSTEYFNGTEHQNIQKKVEQFVKDIDEIKRELQASEENMRQAYAQAIKDVKTFKKEIINYLDDAEREMLELIKERKRKTEMLIEDKKQAENRIDRNISEIQTKLQLQVNQANELFVGAKQIMTKLNAIDKNLKKLKKDASIDIFAFQRFSHMDRMVKCCVPLGEIVDGAHRKGGLRTFKKDYLISSKGITNVIGSDRKSIYEMDAYYDCEINIKTQGDASDCDVDDCVLISPSKIIVTDRNNDCLKIVNICTKEVSKCKLKYRPYGVSVVSPNLVAVTFRYEKKIQFLTLATGNKINESGMIKVHKCCNNIAIHEDKIIGITSTSVEIMSMGGQLIQSISHPNMVWLMDIAVVPSSQMFYVSNGSSGYKAVCKFDFDGNLIATYQDKDLVDVRGLEVTRDGIVLVCNWASSGSIRMITPDCKKIKELLKGDGNVSYPYCVTFCNETNKLFVVNSHYNLDKKFRNVLKVFQLK
jgi:hypothetical protein